MIKMSLSCQDEMHETGEKYFSSTFPPSLCLPALFIESNKEKQNVFLCSPQLLLSPCSVFSSVELSQPGPDLLGCYYCNDWRSGVSPQRSVSLLSNLSLPLQQEVRGGVKPRVVLLQQRQRLRVDAESSGGREVLVLAELAVLQQGGG